MYYNKRRFGGATPKGWKPFMGNDAIGRDENISMSYIAYRMPWMAGAVVPYWDGREELPYLVISISLLHDGRANGINLYFDKKTVDSIQNPYPEGFTDDRDFVENIRNEAISKTQINLDTGELFLPEGSIQSLISTIKGGNESTLIMGAVNLEDLATSNIAIRTSLPDNIKTSYTIEGLIKLLPTKKFLGIVKDGGAPYKNGKCLPERMAVVEMPFPDINFAIREFAKQAWTTKHFSLREDIHVSKNTESTEGDVYRYRLYYGYDPNEE